MHTQLRGCKEKELLAQAGQHLSLAPVSQALMPYTPLMLWLEVFTPSTSEVWLQGCMLVGEGSLDPHGILLCSSAVTLSGSELPQST